MLLSAVLAAVSALPANAAVPGGSTRNHAEDALATPACAQNQAAVARERALLEQLPASESSPVTERMKALFQVPTGTFDVRRGQGG